MAVPVNKSNHDYRCISNGSYVYLSSINLEEQLEGLYVDRNDLKRYSIEYRYISFNISLVISGSSVSALTALCIRQNNQNMQVKRHLSYLHR